MPDIGPTSWKSLSALLATLAPIDEDFPPIADRAPDPVELCGEISTMSLKLPQVKFIR